MNQPPEATSVCGLLASGTPETSTRSVHSIQLPSLPSYEEISAGERPWQERLQRFRRLWQARFPSAVDAAPRFPVRRGCCSKRACFDCLTSLTAFRKVLAGVTCLGVACVLSGSILAVVTKSGTSYLVLAFLFVALGGLLVLLAVIGWRCAPADHEPCHMLLGLGGYAHRHSRFIRQPLSRQLPHSGERIFFTQSGILYSEFVWRPPPPSYAVAVDQASSQPQSPPPSYKSHFPPGSRPPLWTMPPPLSRPPSYRRRPPGALLPPDEEEHATDNPAVQISCDNSPSSSVTDIRL